MDNYPENLGSYIGKHKSSLPSPSLCLSLPVIKANARIFHENVEKCGMDYRAHVKTNKTTEITRILLGNGKYNKVIVSTLREVRGLKPLIDEGVVKDVLYGLPVGPSMLPTVDSLDKTVTMRLLIDHIDHVSLLSNYARLPENANKPWSIFIKLDNGSRRAGVPPDSPALEELVRAVEANPKIQLHGFYAYTSTSYASRTLEDAEKYLQEQINAVFSATSLVKDPSQPLVLSIGSSPTARVLRPIREKVPSNITFEIHAGSLIFHDLQQLATGSIDSSRIAISIIGEVCSVYPHRNEALVSCGVLALTREPGPISCIARVRDAAKQGWTVGRVSQEHGILTYVGTEGRKAESDWKIGDKVELDIQHSCIAAASHGWFFVTDEEGIVRDVYYPWKWW